MQLYLNFIYISIIGVFIAKKILTNGIISPLFAIQPAAFPCVRLMDPSWFSSLDGDICVRLMTFVPEPFAAFEDRHLAYSLKHFTSPDLVISHLNII